MPSVQRLHQLCSRDWHGPKPGYLYACGEVCKVRSLADRGSRKEAHSQYRGNGIARSRHIKDLSSLRRQQPRLSGRLDEEHSLFTQREEQTVTLQSVKKRVERNLVPRLLLEAQRGGELPRVRLEYGGSREIEKMSELRVDYGRDSPLPGSREQSAGKGAIDHTLVVVFDDQRVCPFDGFKGPAGQALVIVFIHGRRILMVDPQHLLMACEDPSLPGGGPSGHGYEIAGADSSLIQSLSQQRGRIVRPHRGYEATIPSECRNASSYVCGTARRRDLGFHADDRDGRLGGYPVHGATDVHVKHGVTHDQDSAAASLREEALGLIFRYQWRVWEHDIVLRPI